MQQASVSSRSATRPFGQKYAFVVVAVIFVALLTAAGLRATPGVLILPLHTAFGWSIDAISFSAAVGIFLYGLAGPFAAAVMNQFGIRRTVIGALVVMSAATAASSSSRLSKWLYTAEGTTPTSRATRRTLRAASPSSLRIASAAWIRSARTFPL